MAFFSGIRPEDISKLVQDLVQRHSAPPPAEAVRGETLFVRPPPAGPPAVSDDGRRSFYRRGVGERAGW